MISSLVESLLDPLTWITVPFHFWTAVSFLLGGIVGSFLNVCIHRLPRQESLWRPGSHCPHCGTAIPWRLNLPMVSWLWLRGRCAFCGAPIPARYLAVEVLTAVLFAGCWVVFGGSSVGLALAYGVLLSGLLTATVIDAQHFIIPDQITLGGIVAGVGFSFIIPELHGETAPATALGRSLVGAALGGGIIYTVIRVGKVFLGRHALEFAPGSKVCFGEGSLSLPDREIPYEELLYRRTDCIRLGADRVEMVDRCYWNVVVEVTREHVRVGADEYAFADIPGFEVVTARVVLPREVMGQGDVKFMATIGAFLGWQAVIFSLIASAMIGSLVGLTLIALRRHARGAPMPYGPFLALGAAIWVFAGPSILRWWLGPGP